MANGALWWRSCKVPWHTQGPFINPAANVVLADTGSLVSGGTIYAIVLVTGSAVVTFRVEHRNALNDASLVEFTMRVPANDTRSFDVGALGIAPNERLRIVNVSAVVGNMQAMISRYG